VFERNVSPEGADILIVDYPSGTEHPIFGQDSWLRYPRWHPSEDSLIMIGGNDVGGVPAVMIYELPSGSLVNIVCCLEDAASPEWSPEPFRFSVVDAGDLLICYLATPVSQETWGSVKARFLEE
jgi:hypothetical protein